MTNGACVSADKDAVGAPAREIEGIDLPVLLVEEEKYLALARRSNNPGARQNSPLHV